MCKILYGDIMRIKYNTEKINRILNGLSLLTGVSIDFLDENYNIITEGITRNPFCLYVQHNKGNKNECKKSDKLILEKCKISGKLESHICHAGLYDFAMPLKKRGITVGYFILGQIKSTLSPENYGKGRVEEYYKKTPFYTDEKIESLKDLLPQILFENAITFEFDSFMNEITEYIENNMQKDLSIDVLCKKFNVSKNYLYKTFHSFYGCTVNEYITSVRMKKAQSLLKETKEPVYRIAEVVGISNYTYFCKLFKSKNGMSPSKYRILN